MSRLQKGTVVVRDETFHIREWTANERQQCMKRRETDPLMFSAAVAYRCTLKEDGTRYFTKESDSENEASEVVDLIAEAVLKLSGVKLDEGDEKKD